MSIYNNGFMPNYQGGYPQYNSPRPYPQVQPIYQQPMQPMQQTYMQPQQPQMQVAQQSPVDAPIQELRFVTSEEAKAYIVMPNTKALLIDKNNGLAFLKSADMNGQSATECYKFTKTDGNAPSTPIPSVNTTPAFDTDKLITKDEFARLSTTMQQQYNSILGQIESLKKQITGGTSNIRKPSQPKDGETTGQ